MFVIMSKYGKERRAYILLKFYLALSIYISVSLLALCTWLVFASCFCLFWGPYGDDWL